MRKKVFVVVLILALAVSAVTAGQMREGIAVGASVGAPFSFTVVGDYNFGTASAAVSLGFKNLFPGSGYFDLALEGMYHLPFTLMASDDLFMLYPSVGGRLDLQFGTTTIISLGPQLALYYQMEDLPVRIFAKANPHFSIATGLFRLSMAGEAGALWQF